MPRKNKELAREYNKKYHEEHRESIIARHKRNAKTTGRTKSMSDYSKAWKESHKEEIKEYMKNWRATNSNSDKNRNSWLKRNYGISLDEYDSLFQSQNYSCAICGKQKDKKSLPVDHEHVDGYEEMLPQQKRKYIRGIICKDCNQTLGLVKDNIETLENMINYLKAYRDE